MNERITTQMHNGHKVFVIKTSDLKNDEMIELFKGFFPVLSKETSKQLLIVVDLTKSILSKELRNMISDNLSVLRKEGKEIIDAIVGFSMAQKVLVSIFSPNIITANTLEKGIEKVVAKATSSKSFKETNV